MEFIGNQEGEKRKKFYFNVVILARTETKPNFVLVTTKYNFNVDKLQSDHFILDLFLKSVDDDFLVNALTCLIFNFFVIIRDNLLLIFLYIWVSDSHNWNIPIILFCVANEWFITLSFTKKISRLNGSITIHQKCNVFVKPNLANDGIALQLYTLFWFKNLLLDAFEFC